MLHAAAWTDVDGAEASPQDAAAVNVGGTQHVLELGVAARALLDGLRLRRPQAAAVPRVGCAEPALGLRPHEAAGRGRGRRRRLGRAHVLAPRLDGHELRPDDAAGSAQNATRWRSSTTSAARPTYAGHLAAAVRQLLDLPRGLWHVAGGGDCTWAELRGGDLRGRRNRLPRPEDRDGGARPAGRPPRVLGAAERAARRARAARTGYAQALRGSAPSCGRLARRRGRGRRASPTSTPVDGLTACHESTAFLTDGTIGRTVRAPGSNRTVLSIDESDNPVKSRIIRWPSSSAWRSRLRSFWPTAPGRASS